jgi:hypothetical protein
MASQDLNITLHTTKYHFAKPSAENGKVVANGLFKVGVNSSNFRGFEVPPGRRDLPRQLNRDYVRSAFHLSCEVCRLGTSILGRQAIEPRFAGGVVFGLSLDDGDDVIARLSAVVGLSRRMLAMTGPSFFIVTQAM